MICRKIAGWRIIAGRRIFFRSRWEANYARYLQFLKDHGEILDWHHEGKTFWFDGIKRGCVSYLPDFQVIQPGEGPDEYHEVKGWMDARSATKLKRMKKYFPEIKMVVIGADWFKANSKKLMAILPDWEHKNSTIRSPEPTLK